MQHKQEESMRSSSIKSIVAAVLISVTVLAAAPVAAARQTEKSQKSQSTRTREAAPSTDRFAGVRDLINRTLRRLGLNGGISIPTPRNDEDTLPTLPNGPNGPSDPVA
jgi:hypothetical protein